MEVKRLPGRNVRNRGVDCLNGTKDKQISDFHTPELRLEGQDTGLIAQRTEWRAVARRNGPARNSHCHEVPGQPVQALGGEKVEQVHTELANAPRAKTAAAWDGF
jgi:hypothetical protein